jgi:hypothetical protein
MFLNIRLLIVALFASIVALSCELGVFAAFGGSLRPLTHLPTDTRSLQLVSENATRTWGAPFGTGVPSSNINTERTASDAPRLTAFRDGAIAQQAAGPETEAASTVKAPAAGLPAPPEPKPIAAPGTAPIAPPTLAKSASTAPKTGTAVALFVGAPTAQNPAPMAPGPTPEPKPTSNTKEVAAPLQAAPQQAAPASTDKTPAPADRSSAEPAPMVVPSRSATAQAPLAETQTDATGSIPDSATPTSTAVPNAVGTAQSRTVRKPDRKAPRRIAAAKRPIRKKPAPTAGLFVRSVRRAGNGRP